MPGPLPELRLKVRVTGRHPWFYRKMVGRPDRPVPAGGVVFVKDRNGRPVGTGLWNPRAELALRMLAREPIDDVDAWLAARLDDAIAFRERVLRLPDVTSAYRLCHAEGDGLPALILDRLGDVIVAQVGCLGIQQRLEALGEQLLRRWPKIRLVLTLDDQAIKREGMNRVPPPRPVPVDVEEHGLTYRVAPGTGHKTGFFADQREHRHRLRELARGRRVLDLCCNSGGFAMNAARGGARRVRAVDLDEAAVEATRANAKRNRLDVDAAHGDAFDVLRDTKRGAFDLVVLDPPKWAADKSELETACARYRDLNRLALERLDCGGLLVTCSCSGSLSESRFLAVVRDAAAQAKRDARVLAVGGAGPDHPVALECPETRYLKVAWLAVR